MHRKIIAVSVVLIALLQSAGAKPVHRVELAPGYSVEVPDGFAACDSRNNKLLGNAAHLIVLREMCASAVARTTGTVLVNMNFAMPVTISARPLHNFPLSADTFADAGPDAIEGIRTELCSYMLKAYRLDTCVVHGATVAGGPTFIGNAAGTSPQGKPVGIRVYILPGVPDSVAMAFFVKAPVPPGSLTIIEAIAASLRIAPAPAPAPVVPVTLTAEGVTMTVPQSWSACDVASSALLTKAPPEEAAGFCAEAGTLRVFYPRPPYYQFVEIGSTASPEKIDPHQVARMLAADQLAKDHDADCRGVAAPMVEMGAVVAGCDDVAGNVAGRPAKIVTFTAVLSQPGKPGPSHIIGRNIAIPLTDRMIQVRLLSTSLLAPKFTPAIDQIVASLVIP